MKNFFYGVIEGFYGKQWSWLEREQYAGFLAQHAFDCYIYAPKGDLRLRSEWRKPHSVDNTDNLIKLGQCYQKAGVRWGVGLSPLGLAEQYTAFDAKQLQKKVQAINNMKPDILCILFDDIRGDISGLAERQLEIVHDILMVSQASHHIVCPTYYSFDPVLEKVFGKMPEAYLETLGLKLDQNIDIFWTGNHVISKQYSHADLKGVEKLINRKPIIWDNYPVNDGRITSNFLNVGSYTGRPYQLQDWSAGHIVNPMNQPNLSRLVLQSLEKLYQQKNNYDANAAFQCGLENLVSESLAAMIKSDKELFQCEGLSTLDESQRMQIQHRYRECDSPFAQEIINWLAGDYQFDPQCLTD